MKMSILLILEMKKHLDKEVKINTIVKMYIRNIKETVL